MTLFHLVLAVCDSLKGQQGLPAASYNAILASVNPCGHAPDDQTIFFIIIFFFIPVYEFLVVSLLSAVSTSSYALRLSSVSIRALADPTGIIQRHPTAPGNLHRPVQSQRIRCLPVQ